MKKNEIRIKRPLTNIMTVEERIYDMLATIGITEFHLTDQLYGQCITFRAPLTSIQHQIITHYCRGLAEEFNHPAESITLHIVDHEFDFEDYMNTDLDGSAQENEIMHMLDRFEIAIEKVLSKEPAEFKQQARKALADMIKHEVEHWLSIHRLAK